MKVLLVNTFDRGGAANACIRLHLSLLEEGVDSHLLFLQRFEKREIPQSSSYEMISFKQRPLWKRILVKFFPFLKQRLLKKEANKARIKSLVPHKLEWFSFPDTGIDLTEHPAYKNADIVNLHWVSDFLDYTFFKKNNKPVVWTLHDMNAFTGGCHYSSGCKKFEIDCYDCPLLEEINQPDFTREMLLYKEKYLGEEKKMQIVVPSSWLGEQVEASKIFKGKKIYRISYGIDSTVFQPRDKIYLRTQLGLPLEKRIILFVSFFTLSNKRKGYGYFIDCLSDLKEHEKDTVLCVIGGENKLSSSSFKIFEKGRIEDEHTMSMYYSACDAFVIPSLEDNLPNTVLESLLCGTPVVGFPVGGIKDMVIDGKNGFLADAVTSDSLSKAINKLLTQSLEWSPQEIREDALHKYDSKIQATAYYSLYKNLVK